MTVCVAQYTGTYLPLTEGWIYDQMRWAKNARSIVLARSTSNLELFPWEPIYSLADARLGTRIATEVQKVATGIASFHREACRRESVDILHAHFGERGRRAVALARSLGIPLVTSFYGRDMSRGASALRDNYRELFREGALFVVEGPAAMRRLTALGCPEEKIRIHRLGIDPVALPFQVRDFNSDRINVLMAARFVEKKGLPYGMEAFCRAAARHPELYLTVVGDAHDNAAERKIRSDLHEIVRKHRMESRVRFTGFVLHDAFFDILAEHHLFLQPSVTASDGDSEGGHPVALTQAAASGMPIIASRHDDIPEIVMDGINGWLVEERDVEQIVTCFDEALGDRAKLREFSAAGRELVESRYNATRDTLDDIYAEALDLGRRKVSVLVTTYNEREVILECLASVSWADEIYVVDSFSTDDTLHLIRTHCPRARVEQRKYKSATDQKNYAIPRLEHDWVLVIDADERVTADLRREIETVLASPACAAYSIRRRNFVLGKPVRWSGLQRDRVTRLFDRKRCRYPDRLVHADITADGPVGRLRSVFDHLYIRSLDHATDKMVRYARWGALQLFQSGKRVNGWEILAHPAWRFFRDYLLNLGFLDGSRGVVVVLLHTAYTVLKYIKLWELQRDRRGIFGARVSSPARSLRKVLGKKRG